MNALTCSGVSPNGLSKVIYVSPAGVTEAACGTTPGTACRSLQQGINNCKTAGCSVLVRYGVYNEGKTVAMADGVNMYGGCVFEGVDRKERSVIEGRPALSADGITKPTLLFGFTVRGLDAQTQGTASIAMTVSNSSGITFSHNMIESGKGGNGHNGLPVDGGVGEGGQGSSGNAGGYGGRACLASPPANSAGMGGKGADFQQVYSHGCFALCSCENNNYPNSLGKNGNNSGSVKGGTGGDRGSAGCDCSYFAGDSGTGPVGNPGNPGQCGTVGGKQNPNTTGSFNGVTWLPNTGGAGDNGQVGSGGGGGGSGGYAVYIGNNFQVTDLPGRPGGGGGGGGCGGTGGGGGGQGGASIPLVLYKSTVAGLPDMNRLVPGPGGRGGNGAPGGKGGSGGTGASGNNSGTGIHIQVDGFCSSNGPGAGGKGGDGGQGGAGSGGAGGNGGPSFGIALVSSPANFGGSVAIDAAQPGQGGSAGAGGQNNAQQCTGAKAADGQPGFSNNDNSVVQFQ